jgi:hypothetical protein
LFWQPPTSGKALLQQFLRLKVASNLLAGQDKGVMDSMRRSLANGLPVEVLGYMLSSALASGLEQAVLAPPAAAGGRSRLQWMEVSCADTPVHGATSLTHMGQWQGAGYAVSSHIAQGPAFWQSSEIEEVAELLTATTRSLCLPAP